uniref:Si:dkey-31g6.6 n=1 Tax=Gadus morhua TaxID=8049 RepID=A0A8C4Z411_GADMO
CVDRACLILSHTLLSYVAKQLFRSKRQQRPAKAGHPDEPMREHMLHMQALDQRAQETNLEHWLNPHCYPRCDRNYGSPV